MDPVFSRSPLAAPRSPAMAPGTSLLEIHDTDLVSTIVYSRHHYGDCPAWIVGEAKSRLSDLYLLLEHGDAKEAWVNPQGGHVGRGPGWPDGKILTDVALPWLVQVLKAN